MAGKKAAAGASAAQAATAAEKMRAVRGGRSGQSSPAPLAWLAAAAVAVAAAAVGWPALQRALAPTAYGRVLPVPRLDARQPGALAEFYERYHLRTPVVIEGAIGAWPAMNWTPAATYTIYYNIV